MCEVRCAWAATSGMSVVAGLQFLEHPLEREAAHLLPRRELLEGRQEPGNDSLCRNQQEDAVDPPMAVVHRLLIADLEWIGTEVEELWQTKFAELILPHVKPVGSLLLEDDLPLVVAKGHQVCVVAEVEEL